MESDRLKDDTWLFLVVRSTGMLPESTKMNLMKGFLKSVFLDQ